MLVFFLNQLGIAAHHLALHHTHLYEHTINNKQQKIRFGIALYPGAKEKQPILLQIFKHAYLKIMMMMIMMERPKQSTLGRLSFYN